MRDFLQEIRRRNVAKVALVYIVAAWLTMQVVDVMFPALQIPAWLTSAIAVLLLIGFPFALIFAWAFELTPDGIKREKDVDRSESITPRTGRKLNTAIMVILVAAVSLLLVDKFVLQPGDSNGRAAGEPAEIRPSIAVLPFVNMSDDTSNEYFSDGLSEELLNVLAKIPQLQVAGRTSSFQFKGMNKDLRKIGEQLNVANVLEGSVRKSGPRIRITAQLIDADSGYHLWSNTYDRELTDVFEIQDEIANNVVDALRLTLLGEAAVDTDHGTRNTEAYNLYLQALYFADQTTAESYAKADEALRKALSLDPGFARAYATLANLVQISSSGFTGDGSEDFIAMFRQVHEYADKALALDPDLAEAYLAKGNAVAQGDWDYERAMQLFRRAAELSPGTGDALSWMAFVHLYRGDFDEGIELFKQTLAKDPLSVTAHRSLGDAYRAAGRTDDALRLYDEALRLQPSTARIHGRIARIALARGDFETAATHASREPVKWARDMYAIMINSRGENSDAFQAAARAYETEYGVSNSYQLAEIYGFGGDLDNTFKWLQMAYEVHDPGLSWMLTSEFLRAAHDDPRWPEAVAAAGLAND